MSWFRDADRGVYDEVVWASATRVRRALALVKDSDLPNRIAAWRDADRERYKSRLQRGGQRPWFTDEQVLTITLLAQEAGHTTVKAAVAMLGWGMDRKALRALGVEQAQISPAALYARLDRAVHATEAVYDPHPPSKLLPRGVRNPVSAFRQYVADLDPEFVKERQARANDVITSLALAGWRTAPVEVRDRFAGNVAVDETFLRAYAGKTPSLRNQPDDGFVSIEPFAGWYVRQGDHYMDRARFQKLNKQQKSSLGKAEWGYGLTLVTTTTNDPAREAVFPNCVLGGAISVPGVDPPGTALAVLRRIRGEGLPAGTLAADRVYAYKPHADQWALPLAELGYDQMFDMSKPQLAQPRMFDGAVMLESNLYCPCILSKPALVNATRDYRYGDPDNNGERSSWTEWQARMAARAPYLLRRHGKPRPDGSSRYGCPAGTCLSCPLRRDATFANEGKRKLLPIQPKDVPRVEYRGGFCNNPSGIATLQAYPSNAVDPDDPNWKPDPDDKVFARYLQTRQFGSEDWWLAYGTGRQTIESLNAQLKDASGSRLRSADSRRRRGWAALATFTAVALAAHNVRKISRWVARQAKNATVLDRYGQGPLLDPAVRRRRDQRDGWGKAGRRYQNTPPPNPDQPPELPPDDEDWETAA